MRATTADLEAARAKLARQVTLTHAAREAGTEARAAAAQAITAMETAQAAQAAAGTRAEAATAAQAETTRQAQAQAEQARAAADAAITAATRDARAQASQLQAETQAAITAARAERDTALTQAAAATAHAQDARDQLTRLRDDHDRHAAELTTAHQAQLATLGNTITKLRQRLHRKGRHRRRTRRTAASRHSPARTRRPPGRQPQDHHALTPPAGRHPPAAGPALPPRPHPEGRAMSELVTARISAHAARLGLHQLAATAPALIQRAHDAQLGYADFLDLILGEETAPRTTAASPAPCTSPACPTTRPSTTSTSPSSPTSTSARSRTSPP